MATNGPGLGMRYVSTTIPSATYDALKARQVAAGWATMSAYLRAVIVHHCADGGTIAERRELYVMPAPAPAPAATAAEPRARYRAGGAR